MNNFTKFFAVIAAFSFLCSAGLAETILTVRVKQIGQADLIAEYSLADMQAMRQHTIVTANEFVDGKQEFQGPLARDILVNLNAQDAKVARLTAANDYSVEVPVEEFFHYDAVLALQMGGQQLSRRDKGPIWVIYPMSEHKELQDPVYNNRLIWQLVEMEIE
ncbi:MAG: molybdopterin-dependent oxidoreductase [Rhodobacteraceae bacterium]|nr:molybdopterin-dependent oxidoreductase [Paracoccaceae bacterium]